MAAYSARPGTPPTPATQPGQLSAAPAASMGQPAAAPQPGGPTGYEMNDQFGGSYPPQPVAPPQRMPLPTKPQVRPFDSPPEGDMLKMVLDWKSKIAQPERMPLNWFPDPIALVPSIDLNKGSNGVVDAVADQNPITGGLLRNFLTAFGGKDAPKSARDIPQGSALPDHVAHSVAKQLAVVSDVIGNAIQSGQLTPEQTAGAVRLQDSLNGVLTNYAKSQYGPASQGDILKSLDERYQIISLLMAGRNTEALSKIKEAKKEVIKRIMFYGNPERLTRRDAQRQKYDRLRSKAVTATIHGKWREREAIEAEIDALTSAMIAPEAGAPGYAMASAAPKSGYSTDQGMP